MDTITYDQAIRMIEWLRQRTLEHAQECPTCWQVGCEQWKRLCILRTSWCYRAMEIKMYEKQARAEMID